jgi:predicted HicB family RNase H-like nuclease
MTTKKMTAEEEHAFYAEPANQVPTGLPVRRRSRLSDPVPVRFPQALLAHARESAAADDRSLSNWIRRAVEHELAKENHEAAKERAN